MAKEEVQVKNLGTYASTIAWFKTLLGLAAENKEEYTDHVYTKAEVNSLLAANEKTSYFLKGLQEFGSSVKAVPFGVGINGVTSGTSPMTSRAIMRVAFLIEKEMVITGVNFVLQTAFVGTGDQYNGFGLYSLNPTTGLSTKITETVNDLDIFKTAAYSMGVKAFPTPQTLTPGIYYIDVLYCSSAQTTAPTIYTWGAISANQILYLTTPNKFTGVLTAQTTLAATVNNSAFTASAVLPSVSLY